MPTITEKYLGALRVECEHVASGARMITDAPVDNHGKGEAFSPTDLCATALGACAMTIMGIEAQKHNLDIKDATMEITKVMGANPRRIARIEVIFNMPSRGYSDADKAMLEAAARNCPVCLSLAPEVEKVFVFHWN